MLSSFFLLSSHVPTLFNRGRGLAFKTLHEDLAALAAVLSFN
jgi:hypothetical protein